MSLQVEDRRHGLVEDLVEVTASTRDVWEALRGQHVFLTGGTGFIGSWLVESFLYANEELHLGAHLTILTRDPGAFRRKAPQLARAGAVSLHQGDVRTFEFPAGTFHSVIHAAADAASAANRIDPIGTLETIVKGTERVLRFAEAARISRFLFISSGAVYGRQPSDLARVPEEYTGAPETTNALSAYGEGKRIAELMCQLYAEKGAFESCIARCFAFIGPYLPLDGSFAAGNFIRDRLRGGPIVVNGDGSARRSYLYASDLAAWLWTMLIRAAPGRVYNVGSESDLSVRDFAQAIAAAGVSRPSEVRVALPVERGRPVERYVPDTRRIRTELGVAPRVDLATAILRTLQWQLGRR